MTLTIGALEGRQWDNPQTGMVLQQEANDIFSLLIFLNCFFLLVLHLAVPTASMRRYLDPKEVTQIVQLLQDSSTSMCTIARGFAVSSILARSQETGIPGDGQLLDSYWIGL